MPTAPSFVSRAATLLAPFRLRPAALAQKLASAACALLFALLGSGCESGAIHYANDTTGEGALVRTHSVIPAGRDHLRAPLAIIEFGDQGNARDKSQIEAARRLIRSVRKPLLVVYVHGWHGNATTYPGRFVDLLNTLADSRYLTGPERGYDVIGVYIGWHGKQFSDVALEYGTTFWNRYDTAVRLGAGVDCLAAISDVVAEARAQNSRARTFLIGHSFGGLLLQQAIAQSVSTAKKDGSSFAPADLTLFLNPASDSEITREMIERLRNNVAVKDNRSGLPVFASLTSETDDATKRWFFLGKSLGSSAKRFDEFKVRGVGGQMQTVSGRHFFTHTPGHNVYVRSHTTGQPEPAPHRFDTAFEENLRTPADPARPRFKTRDEKTGQWLQWAFEPVIDRPTPYWVVQVDRRIMDGHNDIFNPKSIAMMASLYRLNSQLTERSGSVQLARTGSAERQVPMPSAARVKEATRQNQSLPPAASSAQRMLAPSGPVATDPAAGPAPRSSKEPAAEAASPKRGADAGGRDAEPRAPRRSGEGR